MNNRFGTWPACTGEPVTAALWSGFPAFDGCVVSQNSWRRRTLAGRMRQRGKNNKQEAEEEISLWGSRHTHLGSAGARCGTLRHGLWSLRWDEQIALPHRTPSTPDEDQGGGASHAMQPQMEVQQELPLQWGSAVGSPPSAAPKGIFAVGDHLLGPLQAWHAMAASTAWKSGKEAPQGHRLGPLLAHQRAILHPQGWLNAPGATLHWTLSCLGWFSGICGWKD